MASTRMMTEAEHEQVAAAVRAAEENTAGEIHCVVARRSDSYLYQAGLTAMLVTFALSCVGAFFLDRSWMQIDLSRFVFGQGVTIALVLVLLRLFPQLRLPLVLPSVRRAAAQRNAQAQFLSRNIHRTAGRTGVLLFVSLDERYAEVVADDGIDSRVDRSVWTEAVAILTGHASRDELANGFVQAVKKVGALLAVHFPPQPENINEIDDHVVEI